VRDSEYEHLHNHFLSIQDQLGTLAERFEGFERGLRSLAQLEIFTSTKEMNAMAKQSDEINKLSGKFDTLGGVVTDIHADFEALRAVLEADRENLSDAGVAALDAANAKADALAAKLRDLDVTVGDADGSDIPTPPVGGGEGAGSEGGEGGGTGGGDNTGGGAVPGEQTPVDEAPPAGEGTVFAPDEAGLEGDARPTA
jgi:hypothetical protein